MVFRGGPLHRELGPGEFELGLVDKEDAEGEELGVAVAVGAAVEYLDLVVHSFERAGRDRAEVPRQNPVLGLLETVAETIEGPQSERASGPQPLLKEPVRVQLRRLLPQESELFLEQIDPMKGVIGGEQSIQTTAVSRVFLDGVAVPKQQIATAFEDLLALGFQAVLFGSSRSSVGGQRMRSL